MGLYYEASLINSNLKSILTNAGLGSKETGVVIVGAINLDEKLYNIIISGDSFTFYPTNFNP